MLLQSLYYVYVISLLSSRSVYKRISSTVNYKIDKWQRSVMVASSFNKDQGTSKDIEKGAGTGAPMAALQQPISMSKCMFLIGAKRY